MEGLRVGGFSLLANPFLEILDDGLEQSSAPVVIVIVVFALALALLLGKPTSFLFLEGVGSKAGFALEVPQWLVVVVEQIALQMVEHVEGSMYGEHALVALA